ncbi:MAG: zinc-dependent dehydrogenase [Alphaproteobacteria bacterium]|nr:zinc-dependent dehydrogenase [Alphaproteobacteria bacterium]
MKAGVLKDVNEVSYMSIPDPDLSPGDLLLKVKAATVCGTDIRILRGKKTAGIRYPSVLGHEFAGVVVENGGHAQFKPGQAVCVCPQFSCGHCEYCIRGAENLCRNMTAMGYEIDGAFAEYVRIPASGVASGNVFSMPEGLSFEKASLAEPLSCVMNGQEQVGVHMGDVVAILGAGPIGILHVKLARRTGARMIIVSEPNPLRREAALQAGADLVVDPVSEDVVARVRAVSDGLGADVAIVAIGVPSLANDAIRLVRHRGRVSLFAGFSKGVLAELDVNAIHYNELIVTGSFGLTRLQFDRALKMIASGHFELDSLLTHRFGLEDIVAALSTAEQGSAIKVAIVAE